jgi:hypothetical protein
LTGYRRTHRRVASYVDRILKGAGQAISSATNKARTRRQREDCQILCPSIPQPILQRADDDPLNVEPCLRRAAGRWC